MKVWINRLTHGDYSAGLIVVAAETPEQADLAYYEWAKENDDFWYVEFDDYELINSFTPTPDEWKLRSANRRAYPIDGWELLKGVESDAEAPKVLAEENYIE